jgi:hypothetical protein
MSFAHRPDPDDDVTEQVRNAIWAVLDRWAAESDVSIGQAYCAVSVVQDDLMRLMKEPPEQEETQNENDL